MSNDDKVTRKLRAILSADVKGYSLLMADDEVHTIETLKKYRGLMSEHIQQHSGRVVDNPGDNLLAEFSSAVDAVDCAVQIQNRFKKENAKFVEGKQLKFRIGVNIGDVVQDGDRIYGSGVNVAARIEGIAEPGGICVSRGTYDQIKDKLDLGFDYIGEHEVKNIKEPVRVYKILLDSDPPKPLVEEYLELPDKPSIAVMPFTNMSGDSEQEYFSDGMTDDLITDLSKISGLFVIARNSTFTYKGKSIKADQISRELGVRYVLEGSVRKAGDRVRINAQLIDAMTGGHLWAERYDGNLEDVFALQDEVTQKIVAALAVALTDDEEDRLARRYTQHVEAYDYFLRGLEYHFHATKEMNSQARQMFKNAIDLDSEFAAAYAHLGWTHWREWALHWSQDLQCLDQAFELAQRAIALDNSLPEAYFALGEVYLWKKQHEQSIAEFEKSIALNPNYADANAELGIVLSFAGRPEEAIGLVKKAIRLNPTPPSWYLDNLGLAYYLKRQHEKAIAAFKSVLNRNPSFWITRAYLATSYIEIGREQEARAEVAEVLRTNPMISLEDLRQREPYKDQSVLKRIFYALRLAGLPG